MDNILYIIAHLISNALTFLAIEYCCYKCLNNKSEFNFIKFSLCIIVTVILITALNFIIPKYIIMVLVFIFSTAICYIGIVKNIVKSVILVAVSEIVVWFSEFTLLLFVSIFLTDSSTFINNSFILLISNIYIFVVSIIIISTKIPKKLYYILNSASNAIKNKEILILSIMTVLMMIIATVESNMNLPFYVVLITNTIIGLTFIFLIVDLTRAKFNLNQVNEKYETSITSLKEYENMLDKYKMYSHENKNELRTIKTLLKTDGVEKATTYINQLLNSKVKDNEKIMKKTYKIPEGGIRAIIYQKLCLMDKLKIKYKLNIADEVKTADLININDELILNICKVLGVFLDNAIEAVKNIKKKNVEIEIYVMDNYLCFDITNNYQGNLDLEKISKAKYTTKGKGHGYGLALVSQIIEDNSKYLENEKSISGDTFTQTLKIKM